jgi:hypothetical protein
MRKYNGKKKSVFTKLVTVFKEIAEDISVIIILNSKHTQTPLSTDFNTNISFMSWEISEVEFNIFAEYCAYL